MDLDEKIRRDFEEMMAEQRKKRKKPAGVNADFGEGAAEAVGKEMGEQERPKPEKEKAKPKQFRPAAAARPAVPLITPGVQANVLQGAIDQATDAISDENKSRVSQLREMRRMQHEKELEMIRAQASLERVRQARMADQYSMPGGVFDGGRLIDTTGTGVRVG